MPFDTRSAWVGSYGAGRTEQVRVEAAAWQGRAVYFSIGMIREPAAAQGNLPVQRDRLDWLLPFLLTMLVFVCVSAALVARHNLRAGRVDRNGARRVAVVVFVCGMFSWGLTTTHVPSPWEVGLLFTQVGQALEFAGLYWLGYIAVEPYMRRYWPESLISWNRLHSGRVRDPLVASHVMAGIAAWGVTQAVAAPMWQLLPLQAPENVRMLDGTASFVAFLGGAPAGMLAGMEVFLVLVVVLRLLTRDRAWIAEVLACVMYGLSGPIDDSTVSSFALSAAAVYLTLFAILWLIRRFGFVAMLSAWLGRALLMPLVLGSWYTPRGLIAHFIPVAVAAWALWVILSDRRTASVESVG
jgi:hypothetical protein